MNERSQITYMQVRLVRMATEKWSVPVAEAAGVFQQYQVFEFIRDCYGIFHVEGDEAVWEEIVPYLQVRGYDFRTV
ncbi:MAG: DUF3791 domain-containing protein [Clostridia bacterium]|nr:DUF3791 domain-containing protein [Clostridia bacterium]